MNRRDRGDGMAAGGGVQMIPGGRGLGGGVWLALSGLPRDWREMDVFRAMEKRYGKVNQVRRGTTNEREALVQFVSDTDARFVWHLRELELYDRNVSVDLAPKRGGRDDSPPPLRSSAGAGFPQSRLGGLSIQPPMRRQFSPERQREGWNEPRNFASNNNSSSFGGGSQSNGNGQNPPTPLPEDDEKSTRTLFVGNLEYSVTESMLRSLFSKYGLVQDVDIKRPMQVSGNGVAYAFVRFLHLDFAYRAKCELNGCRIGSFNCKIGYGKTNPTTRVWVGNLNYPGTATDLDENRLFEEFDRFGQIKKIDYVRGEHYGYITFASVSASQEACAMMRGATLKINGDRGSKKVRLRVDYADPDDPYLPKMSKTESVKRRGGDESRVKDSAEPKRRRAISRSKSGSPPPPKRESSKTTTKRRRSSPEAESEPETKQRRTRAVSGTPPPKPATKSAVEDRKGRDEKRPSDKPKDSKRRPAPVTETLADFRSKSDTVWKGSIVLKSTAYPVSAHLLRGPIRWLNEVMSQDQELQITRRLRLEEEKLKDVTDKMVSQESATLICFDTPAKNVSVNHNGHNIKPLKHLQSYLLDKDAAGVINNNQAIIYVFPSSSFSNKVINEDMPTLILPENGATVRDEDLGILMIVSNPNDASAAGGNGAE